MAFSVLNSCATLPALCAWIILSIFLVLSAGESFCRSSFFALQKNRYLPEHVIHIRTVTSILECSMSCLARDDCQSWNMQTISSGYTCELNNVTMETAAQNDNTHLVIKEGAQFGQRVSIVSEVAPPKLKPIIYLFTSLGARGNEGPNNVDQYAGTSLQGQVTLDNGIQKWTVPHTGTYQIEARGASGANGTCRKTNTLVWHLGGLGARIKGRFDLKNGTILKILVGQSGTTSMSFGDRPGGGGGGSFVTFNDGMPLIIAGGGGGGGGCIVAQGMSDGDSGQMGELGTQCNSTVKQGGLVCSGVYSGAGAGLLGDGKALGDPSIEARAFVNGGRGGWIHTDSLGGFGGGGMGWLLPGGGGGYSGGGVSGNFTGGVAGGGGSFNNGLESEGGICDSKGDGLVKIYLIG